MALANVSLTNTFDEWRTVTNQIITYVNDIDDRQLFTNIFGQANAAYARANVANAYADIAYNQGNTAYNQGNTAYNQANTAYDQANNAYNQGNTAYNQANAAYAKANSANITADLAYAKAFTMGTLGTQSSSSVSITGGSISGITDLAIADGGTGASTAANARTNLGLGTLATLNSVTASQIDDSTITVGKFAAGAIANAYVNDIVYGGVGSYVLAFFYSGTGITEANTISGSSLTPAGLDNSGSINADASGAAGLTKGSATLSGTWKAMGRTNVSGGTRSRATLFFRIA